MILLTTGATVLEWPGGGGGVCFVSLYNGKQNEALDARRYICDFVKK